MNGTAHPVSDGEIVQALPDPCVGGDPGVRLIEPATQQTSADSRSVPQAFHTDSGSWQVVPLFHLFGSEELSRHSPGIAELSPRAYVALNPADAALVGAEEGEPITVSVQEWAVTLPVVLRPDL